MRRRKADEAMTKVTTEKLNDQIDEVSGLIAELGSLTHGDNFDAAKERLHNAVVEMVTMALVRKTPRVEARRAAMYERALQALAHAKPTRKHERSSASNAALAECLGLCRRIGM